MLYCNGSWYSSTLTALAYGAPGIYIGKDTNPFMNVRKSSNISAVCGSSAFKLSICLTMTLNVNC